MNRFDYIVKIKAIKEMTTQKAREATMREIYSSPDNTLIQQYSWNRDKKTILEQKYSFKCFTKAHTDFTGKNLPNFLSDSLREATTYTFSVLVEKEVSYDELCDFFEFTNHIGMKYEQYSKFLTKYAKIVRDRTLPFTVSTYFSTTYPFKYVAEGLYDAKEHELKTLNSIMEVEDIKRILPSDILYTPIETELTRLYSKVNLSNKDMLSKTSDKLTERITNWVTNAQIIHKTIISKQLGISSSIS